MKFLYNSALVKRSNILKTSSGLIPYFNTVKMAVVESDYRRPESFVKLAFDKKPTAEVLRVKREKVGKNLKYIIVIGIGGSDLGARAVYDALFGAFDNLNVRRFPKVIFVETNDPESLTALEKFLRKEIKSPHEILVNVVSKSGETTETIANFEFALGILGKRFKKINDRIVVTTNFGSKLYVSAEEKEITTLRIPGQVGGRYSVMSSAGLFPLAACGIDIRKFIAGARKVGVECLKNKNNPAAISASVIFAQMKKKKVIHDSFFFHPELESLGKWYRQLVSESLGKKRLAITPTVSVGSTDLHSIGQLYLSGPRDKLTTFISTKEMADGGIVKRRIFPDLVKEIRGKSAKQIMKAILEGVKGAYRKKNLPFMEVEIKDLSPESLGEFMEFKMMETIFLGKLLGVNAFNEPAVELYKKETRRILKGKQ